MKHERCINGDEHSLFLSIYLSVCYVRVCARACLCICARARALVSCDSIGPESVFTCEAASVVPVATSSHESEQRRRGGCVLIVRTRMKGRKKRREVGGDNRRYTLRSVYRRRCCRGTLLAWKPLS